jgi:hypothetical protein
MNVPHDSSGWSRRRFWSLAGLLFVLQAGLILLFGRVGHGAIARTPAAVQFRALSQAVSPAELSRLFFAVDPTVFTLPGTHGFSGRAWLNEPERIIEVPQETEPPAWLQLDTTRLGTNFPSLRALQKPFPVGLLAAHQPQAEPWPIFIPPETIRTQSVFWIRGGLAERQLNPPAVLRSWPSAQLLRHSVVQVAVNPSGQVVSTRLLDRSGLVDADTNALDLARTLRFRPIAGMGTDWGELIFQWQTADATNGNPLNAP